MTTEHHNSDLFAVLSRLSGKWTAKEEHHEPEPIEETTHEDDGDANA
jgi:hypothetical protein